MTEQERFGKRTSFLLIPVIRECALLTIQKEAACTEDCRTCERLDAVSAIPPAEPSAALQRQLDKAVADLHFVMAGGDPCKICSTKCTFGEKNCKPLWRGEAGGEL